MSKQKRLGASRAAMERMHRIHQLLQNKQYPNCTKLAKEFEVAKRTMKRDIEFMKDQMCLPIGFDTGENGYFYTETVDHFPELPMSEADVFALYVASKAIEQYKGTPFQRLLETAFRRLTGRLDEGAPGGDVHVPEPRRPDRAAAAGASVPRRLCEQPVVPVCVRCEAPGDADFRVVPYDRAEVDGRTVFGIEEVRFE